MKRKPLSIVNCALSIAAAALLLGCDSDTGTPEQDPRTPLAISAGVSTRGSEALHPGTRATDTTWHAQDAIGIYTLKAGTATVYDGQANYKYTNTAGQGATATFDPADAQNTAYFPADGTEVDVIAYYPYGEQSTMDNGQLTFNVSSQASLPAIDLMTSALAPGHSAGDADVQLVFRHRLAKLAMVVKTDESTTHIDPKTVTVTLHGTATKGTYSLLEQKITSATDVADITLRGRTAIVMPTAAGSGVTFTVTADGKEFTAVLPESTALPAGKVITITITLKEKNTEPAEASIEATITDWEDGPTAEIGAIRFTTATSPTTGEPEITTFTVMKNGASPTIYEYTDGEWSATPGFFLIEETEPTDEFTATATGTEDPISGLTDDLEAPAATMNSEGIINLEFAHTKAKLTVRIYAGKGFTDGALLPNATVVYKDATNDITYTGAEATFIIEPNNFAKDAIIATVEVGEHTYDVKADKDISFAQGKQNTLAITLIVEEQGKPIAGLNVTTKEWEVGEAATASGNRIVTVTGPGDGSTAVAEFTLYKNMGAQDEASVTYKINADSTAYEAQNGAAPFYMEDVKEGDRFIGKQIVSTDSITNVKDIIQTPAVAMSEEGVIDLEFAHIKAKLTINLQAGTDFSGKLDSATVKLLNYSTTVIGSSNTFIMEPDTCQAGSEIATIIAGGLTYKATLNADMVLTAGTQTVLTVTVDPTAVSITVSVASWANGNAATNAVAITSNTLSALPAGKLVLKYGSQYTATYDWNKITLTLDKSVSGNKHIYWENITGNGPYSFTLTFTPTATGTPVKDVLSKTISVSTHGAQLAFTNSNKLAHVNSKIKVTLTQGGSYSKAEWGAIVAASKASTDPKYTTITFSGLSTNAYAPTKGYDFDNGISAIFAPSTSNFGTDEKITIVIPALTGETPVTKNTLIVTLKNHITKFQAGKEYAISITVDKTTVTVGGITVTNWTEIEGTGEIDY